MICTALANLSVSECLDAVKQLDFAEIRLDLFDISVQEVRTIFSAHKNLIATCRPGKYADAERTEFLLAAIDAGAAYVDLEVEASDAFKQRIIEAARAKGTRIIISYHDFEKTPERAELDHVVHWCKEFQPDIIKIACMVNSPRENARLLGLLDTDQSMLIVGMGEQGKVSRIISPLLGSVCTFASYAAEKATAPGQLSKTDLENILAQIQQL